MTITDSEYKFRLVTLDPKAKENGKTYIFPKY